MATSTTNPTPAGWKLVPVEPTPEMVAAAVRSFTVDHVTAKDLLRDAISASPTPAPLDEEERDDFADRMADQLRDVETLLTIVAPRSHMREYQRTLTEVRVVIQEYESARARGRG